MALFRIVAVGKSFDVDGYLSQAQIEADESWHRGDERGLGSRYPNSGFIKNLGDEVSLDLREQVSIARQFLSQHKDDLAKLKHWPGLEMTSLQLSPEIEHFEGMVGHGLFFPGAMVELAGRLGLTIGVGCRLWGVGKFLPI